MKFKSKKKEPKKENRFKKSFGGPSKRAEKPAVPLKKTKAQLTQSVVGMITKTKRGWELMVADRKDKATYTVRNPDKAKGLDGQLVTARLLANSKAGKQEVEIDLTLGNPDDPRLVSLIAIYQNDIPLEFPDTVLEQAESAKPVTMKDRTDLRSIPLVTIDGADARDFDDAVFAEPDAKGWHVVVAIADVAHYVPTGSPLDKEAFKRGNSTYFADRVVPMLPEALSNELCSLKPHVNRACMAVHMWIDKEGELTKWKFERGVMKSHARLTYEQVQTAMDGQPDETTSPLLETVIKPLYGAYACLMSARLKRGTLELELPERKVMIGQDGYVNAIIMRERLESHKLIEEFMICANVAAAAQLEGKGGVCLYRIHDKPSEIKLDALRGFLDSLGINLVPARQLHPRMLTQILENAAGGEHAQVINEVMLRSQAQAIYSPDNIGHFGLALAKYAHFTSPIRRYADLMVHRALIRVCRLGQDGLTDQEIKTLEDIGEHISSTERRSASAERDVVDRFTTMFLADKVGATFSARISGVARFGLFARLDDSGADGIIPFHALPRDYYVYNEKQQALIGERHGRVYRLASPVQVRLDTADKLTGSMSFAIIEPDNKKINKQGEKTKSPRPLGLVRRSKQHRR
ncbi:MAG: ribonuclease R [Alphaproteobacteria bacterium]|nr:ribonuclease R [Alphaproteobacteria bacterium]